MSRATSPNCPELNRWVFLVPRALLEEEDLHPRHRRQALPP